MRYGARSGAGRCGHAGRLRLTRRGAVRRGRRADHCRGERRDRDRGRRRITRLLHPRLASSVTPHFAKDGGIWPVHCVAGTPGAELLPASTSRGRSCIRASPARTATPASWCAIPKRERPARPSWTSFFSSSTPRASSSSASQVITASRRRRSTGSGWVTTSPCRSRRLASSTSSRVTTTRRSLTWQQPVSTSRASPDRRLIPPNATNPYRPGRRRTHEAAGRTRARGVHPRSTGLLSSAQGAPRPGPGVPGVLARQGRLAEIERTERVDHHREFLERFNTERALHRTGLRAA